MLPLIKLPVDLIQQTCLFLCKKTIIELERCCRQIYKVTNTSSFISKSNNFKSVCIANDGASIDNIKQSKKRLSIEYISQHGSNFFKFGKLTELQIIGGPENVDDIVAFRNQFKKILTQRWFIMCLESSLRKLRLGATGSAFLVDLFPWSCMSQLSHFRLHFNQILQPLNIFPVHVHVDHVDGNSKKILTIPVQQLEVKFGNYGLNMENNNCKYILNLMQCFDLKILQLSGSKINIKHLENIAKYHSHLSTLRLNNVSVRVDGIDEVLKKNYKTNSKRSTLNINTLSLMYIEDESEIDNHSIVGHQQALEYLNFDKSVKNLTLLFAIDGLHWHETDESCRKACCTFITNVLKKYSFCNLENLNILVSDWYSKDFEYTAEEDSFFYTQFFDILSKNKECINNQFKQFNIGYEILREECDQEVYYTFSWHDKMTDDEIFAHREILCSQVAYFAVDVLQENPAPHVVTEKSKFQKIERQAVH